jgi:hypothetical protein
LVYVNQEQCLFWDVDAIVIIEDEADFGQRIDASYFERRIIFDDQLVLLVEKVILVGEVEELNEALAMEDVILLVHISVLMDRQQLVAVVIAIVSS